MSLMNFDTDNCFYRVLIKCIKIKIGIIDEIKYVISLYQEPNEKNIKITVINPSMVCESYSNIITEELYAAMKRTQNLLVNFEDFPQQLKTLFIQCSEGKMHIKLEVETGIVELIIYTLSDVKELIVLTVPLGHTSQEEIINFLKKRNEHLEETYKNDSERTKTLENRLLAESKQYQEAMEKLGRTCEQKLAIEAKSKQFETENRKLKKSNAELITKCDTLQRDLKFTQKANVDLKSQMRQLLNDVETLKSGLDYYYKKTDSLKAELADKERTTIPADRYVQLNSMFCSAVGDLLKCQLNMKQILSQNETQRSENTRIKDELNNCIALINNLEEKMSNVDQSAQSTPRNTDPSPTLSDTSSPPSYTPPVSNVCTEEELHEMIARLESKLV